MIFLPGYDANKLSVKMSVIYVHNYYYCYYFLKTLSIKISLSSTAFKKNILVLN